MTASCFNYLPVKSHLIPIPAAFRHNLMLCRLQCLFPPPPTRVLFQLLMSEWRVCARVEETRGVSHISHAQHHWGTQKRLLSATRTLAEGQMLNAERVSNNSNIMICEKGTDTIREGDGGGRLSGEAKRHTATQTTSKE